MTYDADWDRWKDKYGFAAHIVLEEAYRNIMETARDRDRTARRIAMETIILTAAERLEAFAHKRSDLSAALWFDDGGFGEFLVSLVEGVVPDVWPDQLIVSEMSLRDGWRVGVRWDYDRFGSLDYFMTPTGDTIDFYRWPDEDKDRRMIVEWRPVGGAT